MSFGASTRLKCNREPAKEQTHEGRQRKGLRGIPAPGSTFTRLSAARRSAHERLSTGALVRWTRACAKHPWRVVVSWLGIVALLIILVMTVGGELRDEFEIGQP